jgi:hypothetical protein
MKLTESRRKLLSAIASSPRTAKHFTHGKGLVLSPPIIEQYLVEMAEHGLLIETDGQYSITTLGRQKLDSNTETAAPRVMIGSGTYRTGDGEPVHQYYRPGSDHSGIKSRSVFSE